MRGGDNENFGIGQRLSDGHWHIASSRRQVKKQEIKIAPPSVGEELLQDLVQHRSAISNGFGSATGLEGEDAHDPDTVCHGRHEQTFHISGCCRERHHPWNRVTIDIGINEPNAGALIRKRDRQICSHRRLADATLA